jgi:hypothetical protein
MNFLFPSSSIAFTNFLLEEEVAQVTVNNKIDGPLM